MAQNRSPRFEEATQQIQDEKSRKKGPISFQIQLDDEQKKAKELILANTVTVLSGKAGSGKTLLACQIALDLLFRKQIKKIIITRPMVSKENLGFMPGDVKEKMDPWLQPIYHNLYMLYNKEKIDGLIKDNIIEIAPVGFMRGKTFPDAVIIADEAQNCDNEQMIMILSRLGLRSKMIVCGDVAQIDLKYKRDSGYKHVTSVAQRVPDMVYIELKNNHRHPLVEVMLKEYDFLLDDTDSKRTT